MGETVTGRRELDELDQQLLHLLRGDARLPVAELGRRIGLSRTATLARVRRLEASGVIRGYHADVGRGPGRGYDRGHAARVGIVVKTPDVASYVRKLSTIPELEEAEGVAGEFDIIARFSAEGAGRLDEILDRINGWRETYRTTTFMVLNRYIGPSGVP
jgi:Lrp/AsnC family leucine-responsive transcriptional regulator